MDKIIKPCDPLRGVLIGQTATLDLAIGPRYHMLRFEIIATGAAGKIVTLADCIALINLKLGGNVQRAHTATELDLINALNGPQHAVTVLNLTNSKNLTDPLAAGDTAKFILRVYLAEPWRKSYAATEAFAWPTLWPDGSNVGTFQVELFIPNTGNVAAASPFSITAFAETDKALGPMLNASGQVDPKGTIPSRNIVRFERLVVPYTAAGEMPITTLNRRDVLLQMSVFTQAGDPLGNMKIEVDDASKRDVTKVENDIALLDREMNPACLQPNVNGYAANRFDLVFDASDLPSDGLVLAGANSFKVTPNFTAANAANKVITLVNQVYGKIV